MPEQVCPHCGKQVSVNAAGICTNCREPVAGPPQSVDPYRQREAETPFSRKVAHQKTLAYQASHFALIAPFVAIVLGGIGNSMLHNENGDATAQTGAYVLFLTNLLLIGLGTLFGLIGAVQSARARAWGTMAMGAVGLALCAGILGLIML